MLSQGLARGAILSNCGRGGYVVCGPPTSPPLSAVCTHTMCLGLGSPLLWGAGIRGQRHTISSCPQPLPGCPLGSPDRAQPHAVGSLSCFPLQCLLDQLLQQLREVARLSPCRLLQPSKSGQVLAFYLAVPGLEVGAL